MAAANSTADWVINEGGMKEPSTSDDYILISTQDGERIPSSSRKQQVVDSSMHMGILKPRFTVIPVKLSRSRHDSHKEPLEAASSLLSVNTSVNTDADSEKIMAITPMSRQIYSESPDSYPSLNGVPPSLAQIVLPRGGTPPRSVFKSKKNSSINPYPRIEFLPHGATIPPLHQTDVHHRVVLTKLLRESENNITYGTSDGKSLKVYSSITSSRLLDSGSLKETSQIIRNRRYPYNRNQREGLEGGRLIWTSKLHFLMTCIGACVGFGSFWRLPYLCLEYGRAAFLVPYLIVFCLGGAPLLLAELLLGQYTQRGPIQALKRVCPLMQGVGIGFLVLSLFSSVYYSLVFSESLLSLVMATGKHLAFCNTSGVLFCYKDEPDEDQDLKDGWGNDHNFIEAFSNLSQIYQKKVLEGDVFLVERVGPDTETLLTLLAMLIGSWLIVYFALWKSVRSIGRITKVSATVPFVLMTVFVWRALTLPGATSGLQYLFDPQWSVLVDGEVWVNAGVQVLMSLNIVCGSSIAFASYNKFWNKITQDVWVITTVSCFSSLLAVIVVFAGIGNVAHEAGLDVKGIEFGGSDLTDLALIVYPRILSRMPQTNFWAALFFLLLLLLGLDSQFASVEVVVTTLQDKIDDTIKERNKKLNKTEETEEENEISLGSTNKTNFHPRNNGESSSLEDAKDKEEEEEKGASIWLTKMLHRHEIQTLAVCLVCFSCSLPFVLYGKKTFPYLNKFEVMNMALLFLALCEMITLVWLYGTDRMQRCLLQMTFKPLTIYQQFSWKIFAPLTFLALWITSWVSYDVPNLYSADGEYDQSQVAMVLADWAMALASIMPVPIFAAYRLYRVEKGSFRERLITTLTPQIELKPPKSPSLSQEGETKRGFFRKFRDFSLNFRKGLNRNKRKSSIKKSQSSQF